MQPGVDTFLLGYGDVIILPKEGLMMGKVGTQEVLGSGYSLTYRDI